MIHHRSVSKQPIWEIHPHATYSRPQGARASPPVRGPVHGGARHRHRQRGACPRSRRLSTSTRPDCQWVINAYTLTFGGLLMLGGRTADLLGRRRMFIAGLALFSGASLACGLATSEATLIAARAIQGVGAAIISPAALSILMTTFDEGAERNKALGIWGAIAGTGGAAGVLLGGILTDQLNWSWIFYINVPVGLAVIALGAPHPAREPGRAGPAGVRPARGRARDGRPLAARVRAGADRRPLVDGAAHDRHVRRLRSCCWPASSPPNGGRHAPLMPLRLFRNRSLAGGERGGADAGRIDLLDVLPADAVHAAGAGLLGAQDGHRLPAGVRRDHRVGRRIAGARHEDRRAHGARDRHGAHRRRAGVLQPGLGGRLVPGRPRAGLHPDRRRARLLVRAGHDRGPGRGRAGRGRESPRASSTRRSRSAARWARRSSRRSHSRAASDYATSHNPTPQLPLFAAVDGYQAAFLVGAIIATIGLVATLTMVPGGTAEALVGDEATEPAAA